MLSQFVKDENDSYPVSESESASQLGRDATGTCAHPIKEIEWITCRGCKGEIGLPPDFQGNRVDCPGCGVAILLDQTIIFRPAAPAVLSPPPAPSAPAPSSPASQPEAQNQPAQASVGLRQKADVAFNWGIASIVLGWTILVPLIGFFLYLNVTDDAKKENTLVPGKATIGFVLSLLFGVAQGAAVIARF